MSTSRWSVQDAKNSFSAVVDAAVHGVPQTVTKHGKPAVVILSVNDYERLSQRSAIATPSFAEHLLSIPQDESEVERMSARLRKVEF